MRSRYSKTVSSSQKIKKNEMKHTMQGSLKMSPFEISKVDIIVPFHGQYQKVTRLIESIYRATRPPFLLTLVDDGSKNSAYLDEIKENTNINCIRNEEQLGFAGALMKGYNQTKFPWIVFMNSDCYVDNINWLNKLGESMLIHKNKGVKMISARYPNSGSDIKKLSSPERPIIPIDEDCEEAKIDDIILKKGEHLPLTCVMCHRELFQKIGEIKPYPFGWYEDQELAHRMNHHNFKQAICANSWVHHDGMSTIKELWNKNPEIRDIMIKNEELCLKDINLLKNSSNNHK